MTVVCDSLDAGGRPRCGAFDAYDERDLAAIGRVSRRLKGRVLCVGSAGLAPHVLPQRVAPEPVNHFRPAHPWLLLQGSRRQISHQQFRALAGVRDLHRMGFPPSLRRKEKRAWCEEAAAALALGKDVAIGVLGHDDPAASRRMMSIFENLFRTVLRDVTLGGVFVSGGRTAEAVCDSLRVNALRVIGEVSAGIPTSRALDGRYPGLQLITKAGGFGGPGTIREILEAHIRAR
jgi:uncharacterized protein YgbK (DUF1537 family)